MAKEQPYKKIWKESSTYIGTESFDTESAWQKIHAVHKHAESRRRTRFYVYAVLSGSVASLLLIWALSFTGLFKTEDMQSVYMKTDYGNRSEIVLPDGSGIQLNSGSEISYSYSTREGLRKVSFQGEAFFNVAKGEQPFIIALENGLEITVLGTSFNLKAYADEQNVQTSLIEGCVEVKFGNNTLIMNPGEIVEFNKQTNDLKRVEGLLSHTCGWLDSKLYMHNMSLEEVCKHLERRYDVEIILPDGFGTTIHYNGVIQEETIMDVMNVLSGLSHIHYQMKGKTIYITSK